MLESNKFAKSGTWRTTQRKLRYERSRWLGWARRVRARHRWWRARRHALNLRLLRHWFRGGRTGDYRLLFSALHRQRLDLSVGLTLRETCSHSHVHSAQRWKLVAKRWDIRKFFERHASIGLRNVRRLATSTIHTAHREIVRTMRPLQQRYAHAAGGETLARAASFPQTRRADLAFDGRPATFAVQGRQLPPPASGAFPISAVDVNHIADHVLRQLDHRISAWRERRGRA